MPKESKDLQETPGSYHAHERVDDTYFTLYLFIFSSEQKDNSALIEKKIEQIFGLLERKSFSLLCSKAMMICKYHLDLLERSEADFNFDYEIAKCFLTSKEVYCLFFYNQCYHSFMGLAVAFLLCYLFFPLIIHLI